MREPPYVLSTTSPTNRGRKRFAASTVLLLGLLVVGCSGEPSENNGTTENNGTVENVESIDQSMFDEHVAADSCEDVPEHEDCVEPSTNALRLDEEERLGFEEISFDRDTKTIMMRLRPGASLPEKIKAGAPIYRGRRDRKPFMAIVESVDQDDRDVRVKVRPADLKEVFNRGRIRLSVPIQSDPDLVVEGSEAEVNALIERTQSLSVDLIDYDCRSTIIDENLPGTAENADGAGFFFGASADVKLELIQCGVKLTGNVDAVLEWDGIKPDVFEFTVGADLEIALEALAELSNIETFDEDFDIIDTGTAGKRIAKFPSFSVNVSGIQVKFTPEIWAGVRFVSKGDVSASAGFEFDASADAGFGWAAGAGFYTIFDSSREFTRLGPTIEQTEFAYVRAYVRPQINVTIAGLVGGSAALEGYVEITSEGTGRFDNTGTFEGRVCYDMDGGIEPILGAELSILGATLVEETWRLPGVEIDIADGCNESEFVEPEPACGPSDECVIDSDCLPAGATSCTVYTCQQDCTCTVFERGGCCETTADCDDGEPSTRDICVERSGSCLHPPVYGYCEVDADCDDGLATTEDTCVDNRCRNTNAGPRDDAAFVGPSPECFSHDDCDDGMPLTDDTCVSGTCRNTTSIGEPDRCSEDSDCDDGVLFTTDTCKADGSCENSPPRAG